MRLKRLELFGFKSFAERVVLDFSAPVIGIVGPNGCGKSNVVDAVRWVLGEQRPTSMRGGEMTDVIFKGSSSRPALAVAEATLVLDNQEGELEGRGSEVSVTRRVYKSGEGEYLIDGQRVRLRDVREMLYGTGLGSRGYSVLEQGKIDAILSANPLERRAIFEEAAGISRYRARKKEMESRLERVLADCLRLDDVLRELERRKRSLKLQAGRAERYLEARETWQEQGKRLARHQVARLGAELERLTGELRGAERTVEDLRAQRAQAEQGIVTREAEHDGLLSSAEGLTAESAEAGAELRGLDERRAQLGERKESARRSRGEEGARIAELERRLVERREEARVLEGRVAELEREAGGAEDRAGALRREMEVVEQRLAELAGSHEAQSEIVLQVLQRRTTEENQLQGQERSRALLAERIERAETRWAELGLQIDSARGEERERLHELEQAGVVLEELERERVSVEGEARGLESQRSELESRRNALEVEIARLASRVEALRDWEQERAGLEAGARELFLARERGDGPVQAGELSGLLADHLHPHSRLSRALDAALGTRAQAVVARSPEQALAIVSWLKERSSGRVSLVLPAGLSGADLEREPPAELLASAGVIGPLLELARPEPGYEKLAGFLLADALLVRDLPSALGLVARFPGWRFATAEGDLVDASGVSGGHQEVTQGPLGRRSFAAELDESRRAEEEERARVVGELERLGANQDERAGRLREVRSELERALEGRSRLQSSIEALRARLEELEHVRDLAGAERTERIDEGTRLEADLVEVRERLAGTEDSLRRERARLEDLDRARAAAEAARDQGSRDEAQARVEATGLRERLEAHRRELVQRAQADEEMAVELERARRLVAEHERVATEARTTAEALVLERDRWLARRGELEQEITVLRAREREGRKALENLRAGCAALTAELERSVGALGERRLEIQRLELSRSEIERRVQEDHALGPDALLSSFQPEVELSEPGALDALAARVRELRSTLDELGPVNLEAVSELREVEERYGFLAGQRNDLEEARRSLEGTVHRLNEESERLFLKSFEEIREHFHAVFRQLFGGGRADVALVEGEHVLESGIEIMARPPGREVLPISLLSGGQRTLTALAILFAVFRAHPSPFCILDEVDAALDDANIGRFLALLGGSLDETQFVVVTHNKGTMSACNLLYGVTMAVRGVSHVVSVELSQVDDLVPPNRRGEGDPSGAAWTAPSLRNGGGSEGGGASRQGAGEEGEPGNPDGGPPAELVTAEP